MLIPYNTDAPLYHAPIATVATIVLNILLFVPVFMHDDPYAMQQQAFRDETLELESDEFDVDLDDLPTVDENGQPIDEATRQELLKELQAIQKSSSASSDGPKAASSQQSITTVWRLMTLEFGKFRPWQWLTANYMHADILHLLGNMFVLWGFGLVVEGKVGWWRFLLLYNTIGIVGWGFVQMVMLFAGEGIGLGASLAIFGILVIGLVWAPANEMQCVLLFGLRPIAFESSIMSIAIGSVFLQLAISAFHIVFMTNMGIGLRITSEILHLIGAVLGLGAGILMLRRNWVDCENWDMFSVWAGKNVKTIAEDRQDISRQLEQIKQGEKRKLASTTELPQAAVAATGQQESLRTQFRQLVSGGKPLEAWAVFCRGQQLFFDWQVPEPDFVSYISQLRKQQLWDHAAGAMREYLQRYHERETTIRLALAQLLVQQLNQPREAWQVLSEVNGALLNPTEKSAYDKIRIACKQRVASRPNPPTE